MEARTIRIVAWLFGVSLLHVVSLHVQLAVGVISAYKSDLPYLFLPHDLSWFVKDNLTFTFRILQKFLSILHRHRSVWPLEISVI